MNNHYVVHGVCITSDTTVSLCIDGVMEEPNIKPFDWGEDEYLTDNYLPEVVVTAYAPRNYRYKFVPMSIDTRSVNWYVNSGTFFNFLKKEKDRIVRDYEKDYPICNLKYFEKEIINGDVFFNTLKFRILPKPFVHLPHEGEPLWRFKSILFDKDGNPDSKGRFSVKLNSTKPTEINYETVDGEKKIIGYTYGCNGGGNLIIIAESGEYYLDSSVDLTNVLYECYPKLTVYEFNYDYVMGMQLFDPTTVAAQLIENVMNLKYSYNANINFNARVNKSETAYQMRIAEIVKNIVESTAYEVSDCFYTFDNNKYDAMLRDAELKRSQMYVNNDGNNSAKKSNGNEAFDILNEFDNNATLNENKEVIKRAITQATASITEEVLPEDRYSIQFNIVQDLIKSLVLILVESLITPKIVLLYEVNRTLMGQDYTKYNIEDFLKSIEGLLVSIVREIRDLILQELLDWCMSILLDVNIKAVEMLVKEQLDYYSRLMKLLFKACSFKASHRSPLDNKLDVVEYPDIDEIDKPKESNC